MESRCPISPSSETDEFIHPMMRLQKRACDLSHIDFASAHAIDEINLARGMGEYVVTEISEKFHQKVFACEDEWFREMFTSSQEECVSNLADFLMQRLGGPTYYSDRKGRPDLIGRHSQFEMTPRTAEKWLSLMEETLYEFDKDDIPERNRDKLMDYFRYTAYFLVAAQEGQCIMSRMATFDHVKADVIDEANEKL